MSVPEMRKLLGLKKTDSYWLVHKNFFKTEVIGGMMRIDLVSFEKWYANQVKYKKVDGEEPGKESDVTGKRYSILGDIRIYIQAGGSGAGRSECIDSYQMDAVRRIPVCRSRKGSEGSQAAVPELVE